MTWTGFVAGMSLLLFAPESADPARQVARPAPLTSLEAIAGWRDLLADGLAGWQGTWRADAAIGDGPGIGPGWSYADGTLHLSAGALGGDLVSPVDYEDFELHFEWRVAAGANSGVKVRVPYDTPGQARIGPEYQVLDDVGHGNGRTANTSAAALYALAAPVDKPVAPAGVFRRGRIVARGDRLEFWLDGKRVIDEQLGSPRFEAARATSKFAGVADFGRRAGHVVLQDHGDEVWFRRVFIRDLAALPGEPAELDLGPALHGWSRVGDASYTGDGSTIVGEVTGGKQSFLITDRLFGDFLMEVDVKMDVAANSGIQVRSGVHTETGVLAGYQIEIDHSARAWSGGLYDEMRRGWLDDLSEDALARAAFDLTDWNRYRIECIGPSIRAWVNGVPTADHLDAMTLRGVIGLQVHNGSTGRFQWRDLAVRDLGSHRWEALVLEPVESRKGAASIADSSEGGATWQATDAGAWEFPLVADAGDLSLRIRYAGDGSLQLALRRLMDAAMIAAAGVAPPPDPDKGPLRLSEDGAWLVTPLMAVDADALHEQHVLEVHAYGDRLAVVQDGRTVADVSGVRAPHGACVLEARVLPGQVLEVLGVDRLLRARP
jgi:hypothetical protein